MNKRRHRPSIGKFEVQVIKAYGGILVQRSRLRHIFSRFEQSSRKLKLYDPQHRQNRLPRIRTPKPPMATVEEFEVLLKEVVNGKRLSASKMEKLTEVSMKLMENDTQLVSILYRTHKSLRANAKISSLYVFDALCRSARNQVVKRNLSGDINTEKGNCATFLLKIDGVLDGLFQDILSSGIPEAKEKTKKILDIWTKSNTFPANVLTRLGAQDKLKVAENPDANVKETKHAASGTPAPTSDPRKHPTPPAEITPPLPANTTPTAEAAQAALLALLSSAAAVNNPSSSNQTPANTAYIPGASPPQAQTQTHLEQLQFALLQQLSKNNNGGPAPGAVSGPLQPQALPISPPFASGAPPFPPRLNMTAQNMNFPGPSSMSPTNREPYAYPGSEYRDPRSNRFGDALDGRGRGEQYFDDRRRGGNARGIRGGFRGRGRGDFRGMSEREHEPHSWDLGSGSHYEGGSPPNRRRLNSRSQSPPPRRRDNRPPYSPPRRPLASPIEHTRAPLPGALEAGKDEFGRDVRTVSEEPEEGERVVSEEPVAYAREGVTIPDVPDEAPIAQSEEARDFDMSAADSNASKAINSSAAGLESFDISSFNPTDAVSWKALGDAFQVTHGYVPSQEELMQLVMTGMGMAMGMGMGIDMNIGAGVGDMGSGASFGSAGSPTGGKGAGRGWNAGVYGKTSYDPSSDAVVLGPNVEEPSYTKGTAGATNAADMSMSPTSASSGGGGSSSGGQMRKVGDRWIFVRAGV